MKPKRKSVLLRSVLIVTGILAALVVAATVFFAVGLSSNFNKQSAAEQEAFKAIVLPSGYAVTSHSVESAPGPVGSTPTNVYEISIPAGKTRQQVVADLTATSGQTVVGIATNAFNEFQLQVSGHSGTMNVLFKPYSSPDTSQPDKAVTSIQLRI